MPLIKDLVDGNSNIMFRSLPYTPLITYFMPVTGLSSGAVLLMYKYFQNEHRFDAALVGCTPPDPPNPEGHLPSHEEWIANGGLKRLPSDTPSSDTDLCIFCYTSPTDPTRIDPCGHIFCAECVEAWQKQASRTCPQCTTALWRGPPKNYSQLERLVKFVAAASLVTVPLTTFAFCCYMDYCVQKTFAQLSVMEWIGTVSLTALSLLILTLIRQGLSFMLQRRKEHGIKWWGEEADAQTEWAFRMSMSSFSVIIAAWILLMSVICECHIGTFERFLTHLSTVIDYVWPREV